MHSINLIIIGKCEDNMHIQTVHTDSLLPSHVMPWHSPVYVQVNNGSGKENDNPRSWAKH